MDSRLVFLRPLGLRLAGAWTPCQPCTDPADPTNPATPPPWRGGVKSPAGCEILPHTQVCTTGSPDANYDMTCTGIIACTCTSSSAPTPCYDGPPETRGVGNCHDGQRVCTNNQVGS